MNIKENGVSYKILLTIVVLGIVGMIVSLFFTGCGAEFIHTAIEGDDGCETYTIRCNGDTAEICNADHSWDIIQKCPEFEPGVWMCCEFDGNVGCHKEEDCL